MSSQDYITNEAEEQFEMNLLWTQKDHYIKYMCYKIFHYLEIIHKLRINKMSSEWL